jgi:hypothetical protein
MKQSLLPAVLCLFFIMFSSCDKFNLPWNRHKGGDDSPQKGYNIVCTGNHITSGPGLSDTDNYPGQLSRKLRNDGYNPVTVTMDAETGYVNIQAMTAQIGEHVDPYKISGAKNIVIVTEITEDTRDNHQPPQVSMNLLAEYCKHIQAHGWTVIVSTAPYQNPFYDLYMNPPFPDGSAYVSNSGYDSSGFILQINQINELVRKNQGSFANGLMDLAADPRLQMYSSKYYMPNHMDLTADGAALIAELAETALKPHLPR